MASGTNVTLESYGKELQDRPGLSLLILLLLALLVRVAQIDVAAHVDEMYHVLAAMSWLENGTFSIGDGAYTRTPAYTILVAGALELFGENLLAARIPALLAGLGWIALVFEWTRRTVGLSAAWVAGLLLALDPASINLAQFARFYTLHGLLFGLGAVSIFWIGQSRTSRHRKAVVAGSALLTLGMAYYFQMTTAIGMTALVIWLVGNWVASAEGGNGEVGRRVRLLLILSLISVGAAYAFGVVQEIWSVYRSTAEWAQYRADQWRFYHWWFEERFPVLWRLYPLALLLTIGKRRPVGLFCAVMFVVPFLIHSGAGPKHERYLYYAMPFFFVTWGIVLSTVLPRILSASRSAVSSLRFPELGQRSRRALAIFAVAVVLAFPVYTSPAFTMSMSMVLEDGLDRPYGQAEWKAAAAELSPRLNEKEAVLATRAVKAMYYLGRVDAELIKDPPVDALLSHVGIFEIDRRMGRPVISSPRGLELFLRCHLSGLIVVERKLWEGLDEVQDGALIDILRAATEPVSLPSEWGLVVREWDQRTLKAWKSDGEDPDCSVVRNL